MPVTNVPAPGSPIRSNWAISVSNVANANETAIPTKVAKAGDTMTGDLLVGANPTATTPGSRVRNDGVVLTTVADPSPVNLPNLILERYQVAAGVGGPYLRFQRAGGNVIGSIAVASSTAVVYNTTSDQRLKEPTGPVDDALDLVAALGALAYRGRWIDDQGQGEEWIFVNSQDVEPVAPFAVHGAPDGVASQADVDAGVAREVGQIIPQLLDHSALVPLLLAAVSQLTARVADLEAGP